MTQPPIDAEDLDTLRRAALSGDADALEQLLTAVRPLVLRRCSRLLPCASDAEEAAQDALMVVATKLSTYSGSGSFVGWVTVVASNCARSTYRSLKRRGAEFTTAVMPEDLDPRTTSVIAGSRLDLLEAIEALEATHPDLVQSFVLRDLAALPYAEVAEADGVPLGTAKARIHRARAFVRTRLAVRDT